jgi:hypothetical protein
VATWLCGNHSRYAGGPSISFKISEASSFNSVKQLNRQPLNAIEIRRNDPLGLGFGPAQLDRNLIWGPYTPPDERLRARRVALGRPALNQLLVQRGWFG